MEKSIRLFFFLVFINMALFGAPNYMQQLKEYDTQIANANHDEVLRIYHGLKAVYIQSIIKGDDSLKKEIDEIKLLLDINTDAYNTKKRFNKQSITEFIKESLILHDKTLHNIENNLLND